MRFSVQFDPGPEIGRQIFRIDFDFFSNQFEICVGLPVQSDPGPDVGGGIGTFKKMMKDIKRYAHPDHVITTLVDC